jgi:hypothetical protein
MIAVGRSDAQKTHRSQLIAGILLATLGLVLIGVGMVLVSGQAADYIETARWPEYSLLDLIKSPTVKFALPGGLLSWFYHPESLKDVHAAVIGCLDGVSASWFFLAMGGFVLWRALR